MSSAVLLLGIPFVVGLIAMVITGIMFLIATFRQSVLWGLACLFIPFASLVFLIMFWSDVRKVFMAHLASLVLMIGPVMLFANSSEFKGILERERAEKTVDYTHEIDRRRRQLERLDAQFATQGAEVIKMHQELTAKQAKLKKGDEAALVAFNTEVAAYQAKNAAQKQLQTTIAATREDLDQLLAKRAKAEAKKAERRVVMYCTPTCPAGWEARRYMDAKGIKYEYKDIKNDPNAQSEFLQMGGTVVPLIIVGTEKMEGFNARRLNQML